MQELIQLEFYHAEYKKWTDARVDHVGQLTAGHDARLWYNDPARCWVVACFRGSVPVSLAELRSSGRSNPGVIKV